MRDEQHQLSLLMNIARMFYDEHLTKTQIANRLDVSSTHVARLLKEAHMQGLVKISYNPPRIKELEGELPKRFPCLRKVQVIAGSHDFDFQSRMLGIASAKLFDEIVTRNKKVGISGGTTVFEMIKALEQRGRDIEIYPTTLIGRGPFLPEQVDPMMLIWHLCERSGRKYDKAYCATIPPFEEGATFTEICRYNNMLKKHKSIARVWTGMQEVDVIFASVGPIKPDRRYMVHRGQTILKLLKSIRIDDQWLSSQQPQIVGDMAYSFFDQNGFTKPTWEFFLTPGVNFFREMAKNWPEKQVVLMAGSYKTEALRAALTGKLCNVLVTDESTAAELLEVSI